MRLKSILVLTVTLLFVCSSSFADIVVLRNGLRHEGSVANRDQVRAYPLEQQVVSLLVEGSGELTRFPVGEIDYVVLEDNGKQEVVDFYALERREVQAATGHQIVESWSHTNASGLVIVGSGMLALGALVKFGGEKATVTAQSVDVDEHSYNALNYTLMVLGGVMVIGGMMALAGDGRRHHSSSSRDGEGLLVGYDPGQGTSSIRIGYRIVF